MALTPPRILHDIKSMTIYDRATCEVKGFTECVGGATLEVSGGLDFLFCSGRLPVAAEPQTSEAKITGSLKSVDDFLFEFLAGGTVVKNAAEPTGNVDTIENCAGVSVVDATTGIDSVAVDAVSGPANLKTRRILLRAASATTVDVFIYFRLDGETPLDDELKLVAAAVTIPGASATVTIPEIGIEITGGTGAIAMVIGETAIFNTRHHNNPGSSIITVSGDTVLTAFGAILATTRSSGDITYIDVPNVSPSGSFNITLEEKAFSINDFEAAALKDPIKGYTYKVFAVRGAGS